ncbi:glycoside hydrolase N-terminal domain-containing protein [Pontiellaceae bacterium B1224]|nr:glycoside hydrolase N-terminal domain-containing protein [Pontiellaceae bacterium B1224]
MIERKKYYTRPTSFVTSGVQRNVITGLLAFSCLIPMRGNAKEDTMKNTITTQYPASWYRQLWREALPSGNGIISAAVYGHVNNERVLLSHDDLWHEVVTMDLPDVSHTIPEIRRLLLDGKPQEANGIMEAALKAAGYEPDIGAPLPLGDLLVDMPVDQGFSKYRRTVDMTTGEVAVRWTDGDANFERKLFVSRINDLIVMEVNCSGDAELDATFTLDLHDRKDVHVDWGTEPELPKNFEAVATDNGFIRYAATNNDDDTDFGAVARVVAGDATLTAKDGSIQVTGGKSALVIVKLFIKGERQTDWAALEQELAATNADYATLLKPHAAEHGELFNRVSLDLGVTDEEYELSTEELLLDAYQGEVPTPMVEKMWAYGRYLLIISSKAGGQPCPLQGKWTGFYRGYWTFNMANENLQMNYWQAMSGNIPETALPVFDYFDGMMDDFRTNARNLYGCDGIVVSCITTPPSGLFKDIQPHILYWTGGGAWVGQIYYDYYLFTGDETFLKERAMPFLREVALFYEDFFTLDENGYYVSAPSNSPENQPGNQKGRMNQTTMNSTMDFALAKEVLTNLIEGAKITGTYQQDVPKWQAMLAKIPPYQINEDGAVREWMHPFYDDNYAHRHQSHIYPVFPGFEVTPDSDPELFEAFLVAIRKRLDIGISSQSGWSLAHMANVYARMGEGDSALRCLSLLSRACVMNNFFTTHNDWRFSGIGGKFEPAPYQIDANFGWTAAVQEMLLFSVPGTISVIPALPEKWVEGSVTGLLARGGVEVSIAWNQSKKTATVELTSLKRDQTVILKAPYGEKTQTIELKAGQLTKVEI